MPEGQPLTPTHPRSGSMNLPWDQFTHTFVVSMAATPVAQRRMGFKAPRARRNEGVSRPTWFPTDACIRRGSDIQLMKVGTVEVGHPSIWFPPDSASGVRAICSGLGSWHGRWSHLVSHGFSRGGGGVNHYNLSMRETEGAELGPSNSVSGGRHHAEV